MLIVLAHGVEASTNTNSNSTLTPTLTTTLTLTLTLTELSGLHNRLRLALARGCHREAATGLHRSCACRVLPRRNGEANPNPNPNPNPSSSDGR